jgi:hypothetical protein
VQRSLPEDRFHAREKDGHTKRIKKRRNRENYCQDNTYSVGLVREENFSFLSFEAIDFKVVLSSK